MSIVTVGLGVSLGREGASQTVGAAVASSVSEWAGLPVWQRRLLVASGAGAGFAAVYDVPLEPPSAGEGAIAHLDRPDLLPDDGEPGEPVRNDERRPRPGGTTGVRSVW
jgi:hypothetical protein